MISKVIRYLGIAFIFIFCMGSIFISLTERDIEDPVLKKFLSYPSAFEDRFYDLRMRLTLDPEKIEDRMILAEIDDESLKKIGRWPWTRTRWAEFVNKMNNYGAKILAFDVFFSEPEMACNAESPDVILANSISKFQGIPGNKVILPYSADILGTDSFETVPDSMFNYIMDTKQAKGINLKERRISKSVYPIQPLLDTEASLGLIEAEQDADGIYRHYPLLINSETLYFPSFSLVAYQLFTGDKTTLELLNQEEYSLQLQKGKINLNFKGEGKIRWLGGVFNFQKMPIYKILEASDDDPKMIESFKNKIVFIGSTAFGAHDLRHTPVDSMLPGIYFHMNMLHMLLEGKFFVPSSDSTLYSWFILVISTLLLFIVMLFKNAILDLVTLVLLGGGLFLVDTYYLIPQGYEIRLFFCLLSMVSCYSWETALNFYLTSKEKRKIRGTFSRFVAPAIVNQMLENPELVRVGGEKKEITVFFSDVRDFTSISEKLTPEQLSKCLNQYMGVMTDILFDTYGTLDKYIGDAIVAYWGAPVHLENHAYHAIRGSIQMIETLPEINQRFKQQGFPEFKHGIGLNTGECSVGNMGSDKIFSYTALGDNMNLGARLESLCKFYGVQLNISQYTKDAIPPELAKEFTFRILDHVRVKGKEQAVTIWEVLHSFHSFKQFPDALREYNSAFKKYEEMKFQEAIDQLKPLAKEFPLDKSTARLINTCENFIKEWPGDDWDRVVTYTTK